MVERVPKTIFRVRKSFSRVFLSRNQSHGRNGAKNRFSGCESHFQGLFCVGVAVSITDLNGLRSSTDSFLAVFCREIGGLRLIFL